MPGFDDIGDFVTDSRGYAREAVSLGVSFAATLIALLEALFIIIGALLCPHA